MQWEIVKRGEKYRIRNKNRPGFLGRLAWPEWEFWPPTPFTLPFETANLDLAKQELKYANGEWREIV